MFALFCAFIPSMISIRVEWHLLKKEEKRILYLISDYLIYVFLNNVLACLFIKLIFGHFWNIFTNINEYSAIMIEYGIIAFVLSILLALIKILFIKNVGVELEIRKKN